MIVATCPGCGDKTFFQRINVDISKLARPKCDACGERIKPKVSRRDHERKLFATNARDMPGLVVFVCRECAGYCDYCRYNWED